MDVVQFLVLLLAGGVSGFLAGFFGIGGGVVLVPILIAFFQATGVSSLVATHLAMGTSLFIIIFASSSSAFQYARNQHVIWKAVLLLGVGSLLGGFAGGFAAGDLSARSLQRIFSLVAVFAAIRLLADPKKARGNPEPVLAVHWLLLGGFGVGIVSALAGVGGGIFAIPLMYSALHFPMKKALGTSSAAIVITAMASATSYAIQGWGNPLLPGGTAGYVDALHAVPVILGTLPTAAFGATVANNTRSGVLRKIFATFLIIIALKMALF
jgi:uncharacterized protein